MLARQANDAVRRWRWKQVAEQHPTLPAEGANFGPIAKLLKSKRDDDVWNPALRGALTSLVVGRQYTQYRCFQAGWTLHSRCILCLHNVVTGDNVTTCMPPRAHDKHAKQSSSVGTSAITTSSGSNAADARQPTTPPVVKPPPPHEAATPEMIQAAPVGTLKHRNYLCPALEPERIKHAPPGMRYKARLNAHSDLAMERALMPAISHIVPPPSKAATFQWALEPPGGVIYGRIYTDGSRLDGPLALLARNG